MPQLVISVTHSASSGTRETARLAGMPAAAPSGPVSVPAARWSVADTGFDVEGSWVTGSVVASFGVAGVAVHASGCKAEFGGCAHADGDRLACRGAAA